MIYGSFRHLAAFHHELHSLQLGDVGERIACDSDQVGIFTFVDGSDAVASQALPR